MIAAARLTVTRPVWGSSLRVSGLFSCRPFRSRIPCVSRVRALCPLGVPAVSAQHEAKRTNVTSLHKPHNWRCYSATVDRNAVRAVITGSPDEMQASDEVSSFVLNVGGMKCGGCSSAVKRILVQQPYVVVAGVNLLTETAAVTVTGGKNAEELAQEAADLLTKRGFPSTLRTPDSSAFGALTPQDGNKDGIMDASLLNLGFAWSLVLVCCLHHAGHWLHSIGWHEYAHTDVLHALGNPWVSGVLGGAALLGPGRQLIVDGAQALYRGAPNMNSLIGLGAATSFIIGISSFVFPGLSWDASFIEEPVMLLAFVLLGRTLEARARAKASADLRSLACLIPNQARLVLDPGAMPSPAAASTTGNGGPSSTPSGPQIDTVLVPTPSVRAGDVVRVLPGERFPVDGVIVSGRCGVDESMLTGESMLVPKAEGSEVCAGTVNYESAVILTAQSTGKESRLAGIGRLVADAMAREAPVQRLADAVAGKFCYTVMGASAATFAFWSLLGPQLFPWVVAGAEVESLGSASLLLSLKLAVDVLVVACPCALGLATPTAVVVASSMGAKRGLLLRGGDVLEAIAGVDTVVLDKTGTLTEGRMKLTQVHTYNGHSANDVLRLAGSVESGTRHPLADAVLEAVRQRGSGDLEMAAECSTVPGSGVSGFVGGHFVAVGKRGWVEQQVGGPKALTLPAGNGGANGSGPGGAASQTVVYVGVRGEGMVGSLGFSDTLRPEAQEVVQQLRQRGCDVVLLSGDNHDTAYSIAHAAHISRVYADMQPEDKVRVVSQLQMDGRRVAMVGDGVNDAPALATAHVGVAMGSGTEAAGSASDVVLMGNSLTQVVEAIDIGRATLSKIKQNLIWALTYNIIGIPLAAGVLLPSHGIALSPSVAGGLMAISSVAVVSNSLLLRAQLSGSQSESHEATGQATQPGLGLKA